MQSNIGVVPCSSLGGLLEDLEESVREPPGGAAVGCDVRAMHDDCSRLRHGV